MNANNPSPQQTLSNVKGAAIPKPPKPACEDEVFSRCLPDGSAENNRAVASAADVAIRLGARFVEVLQKYTTFCVLAYGDDSPTRRRATADAIDRLSSQHHLSTSTVRLYIQAYNKFYTHFRATEHLRLTDMQLLLPKDIGDDIVEAIIQMRMADPGISTKEVKRVIGALRQQGSVSATPALTPAASAAQ